MRWVHTATNAGRERRWAAEPRGFSSLHVILRIFHFYGGAVSFLRRRDQMISGSLIS